jgi:hypothetical protein
VAILASKSKANPPIVPAKASETALNGADEQDRTQSTLQGPGALSLRQAKSAPSPFAMGRAAIAESKDDFQEFLGYELSFFFHFWTLSS